MLNEKYYCGRLVAVHDFGCWRNFKLVLQGDTYYFLDC